MVSGVEKSANLGAFCQSEKKKEKDKKKKMKMKMKKEKEEESVGKKITIGVCVMEKKVKCGSEVLFYVLCCNYRACTITSLLVISFPAGRY